MKVSLILVLASVFWMKTNAAKVIYQGEKMSIDTAKKNSVVPKVAIDTPITKKTIYVPKNANKNTPVSLLLKKGSKYKITVAPVKFTPDQYLWYKKISIIKSFDNATDKAAAASGSLIYPKDSVGNQNFAFAVGYNVWPSKSYHNSEVNIQLNPFFGWQKNTLSTKKQDVMTYGFNGQISLPKFSHNDDFQFFAVSSLNYKNDRIKSAEGTQGNLYLSPIFNGHGGKFYFLPDAEMKNDVIKLIYNVFVGVEHENVASAKNDLDKGTSDRFYTRITATFAPLPELLNNRLQFIPDYTYRTAISNSIANEKNDNKLWKYTINFVLINKDDSGFGDVSFGYDLQKGVDPAAGYQNQTVRTFSIKVKIIGK